MMQPLSSTNPDIANRYCWHCGGSKYSIKGGSLYGVAKNANSIGFEICSTNSTGKVTTANDKYWSYTDAVLERTLELVKYLMDKYGIDASYVIRHYDVTGKPCPGILGWNADSGDESKWQAIKAKLTGATVAAGGDMSDAEMYAYFKSQGLTDCGVSGLMGTSMRRAHWRQTTSRTRATPNFAYPMRNTPLPWITAPTPILSRTVSGMGWHSGRILPASRHF